MLLHQHSHYEIKSKPAYKYKPPQKSPSIKYFLADSQGHPVEIDPTKITAESAQDSEIFHEANEDSQADQVQPTIKHLNHQQNTIPLFPEYSSSMFDPMELQMLQEN
eukprot:scaffold117808_cov50-Attheya_sp.AAC.2